jgi:hypothetical protein
MARMARCCWARLCARDANHLPRTRCSPLSLPHRPQIDKCFGFDTAVEEAQRALLAAKVGAVCVCACMHACVRVRR